MKVDDILKAKGRRVSTTSPDTAVARITERLRFERIGALVVSRDGSRIDGIITERDIIAAIARYGADALDKRASDVMTRWARSCAPDDRVRDVMVVMTTTRVRHLPVVEHGKLCGIVSIGDVVKSCLDDADLEVRVLRDAYLGHR
jgi:signal-transduction protein with cAMP-binding, CBS, and nucleotidyltransferase domain